MELNMGVPELVLGLIGLLIGLLASRLVTARYGWLGIACATVIAGAVGLGYALGAQSAATTAKAAIDGIRVTAETKDVIVNLNKAEQQVAAARGKVADLDLAWLFVVSVTLLAGGLTFLGYEFFQALGRANVSGSREAVVVAPPTPKDSGTRQNKSGKAAK
jgi:hypothetical protein